LYRSRRRSFSRPEKKPFTAALNALVQQPHHGGQKAFENPNGLILGTPGSGKSFSAKREIANVFLVTDDDIIICDPEAEYGPLVERLDGQVIKISPTSQDFINPMDLNLNYSDDENPLSLKSDFILSAVRADRWRQGWLAACGEDHHRPLCQAGLPGLSQ
jgi:hypothetical protein